MASRRPCSAKSITSALSGKEIAERMRALRPGSTRMYGTRGDHLDDVDTLVALSDSSSSEESEGGDDEAQHEEGRPRLSRQTTTVEVYSNLRSHQRQEGDVAKRQLEVSQQILANMKKKANTTYAVVYDLLQENPHVKVTAVDELGKTALHYAAHNEEIGLVNQFLQKGAPINQVDKVGQTALHYATLRGNIEIMQTLITNGAFVDYPDTQKGRTALHFAVTRNQPATVDFLLFCGADVTIKDEEGKSPIDLSKNETMRLVLSDSKAVAKGNELGEIQMESMRVKDSGPSKFRHLGLSISYEKRGKGETSFTMLCRRLTAEHANVDFNLGEEEEVVSDVFSYRLAAAKSGPAPATRLGPAKLGPVPATLAIPLFTDTSNKSEQLVLKTDQHQEILITDVKPYSRSSGQKRMCSVTGDLSTFTSFVVISRPKVEEFSVGPNAIRLKSTVDERVEFDIPKNTFKKPVTVSLKITQPPPVDVLETEGLEYVLSTTSFFSVAAGGAMPTNPISVKVPLPENYGKAGVGKMIVLTMNDFEEDETEESWKILKSDVNVQRDRALFDITSFSVKVAIEVKWREISNELKMKREVSALFRRARRREYTVTFLGMTKRMGDTNKFKVVVECCLADRLEERKRTWLKEGYEDQHPSRTGCYTIYAKQRYKISVSNTIHILGNTSDFLLEFHPRRENFQCFGAGIKENEEVGAGHMEIIKLERKNLAAPDVPVEEEVGELLANIVLELHRKNAAATERHAVHEHNMQPMESIVFFDDAFMRTIMTDIAGEWYKIFILMGIPFIDIEQMLIEPGDRNNVIFKHAIAWRDECRSREHQGVPVILAAMFKGGRRDVANDIQLHLREWHTSKPAKNSRGPFYDWVTKAYKNSDILVPSDYPRPMSDPYLVLMADDILPSYDLAKSLLIPKPDLNDVMGNSKYNVDGLKVMKLLTVFRESVPSRGDALERLIVTLETLNMNDQRNYAVMCAKAWVKRSSKPTDSFRHVVDTLVNRLTSAAGAGR